MHEEQLSKTASKIGYRIISTLVATPSSQTHIGSCKSVKIRYTLNKKWNNVSLEIYAYIDADYKSTLEQINCNRKNTTNCPISNLSASSSGCEFCPAYRYDRKALGDRIISGIKQHLEKNIIKVRHRCFYRFYPVGQGLMCGIYTCKYQYKHVSIDTNGNTNGFDSVYDISDSQLTIYDCGSTINSNFPEDREKIVFQILKNDCEMFKVGMESGKYVIDQLIVSHFDCDHINGINKLSKEYIIKDFIYPFSSNIDKISMLFKHLDNLTESRELFAPKDYLMLNSNVKNIIEVHPGKNLDRGIMPRLRDNTEIEGIAGSLIYDPLDELNNSNGVSTFYKAYMPDGMNDDEYSITTTHKDEVWMQQLIFCLPSGKTYEEVYKNIKNEFIKIGINLETEKPEKIRELIMGKLKTKDGHGEIAYVFRSLGYKADSDTNASSLCFYFGPKKSEITKDDSFSVQNISVGLHSLNEIYKNICNGGVLLTGDSDLDYVESTSGITPVSHAQTLVNEMRSIGVYPGAILLPHHGSEHNISQKSFDILDRYTQAKTWVVSFGINYKFGHPHDIPCKLFGTHILPVVQKEEAGISDVKKRFVPENEILCSIKESTPTSSSINLINNVRLFHCNDRCCILLESYDSL